VMRDGGRVTGDVAADGDGLVSPAGAALLAQVADKLGLSKALSARLRALKQRPSRSLDPSRLGGARRPAAEREMPVWTYRSRRPAPRQTHVAASALPRRAAGGAVASLAPQMDDHEQRAADGGALLLGQQKRSPAHRTVRRLLPPRRCPPRKQQPEPDDAAALTKRG
jgi:hypothetical protein